MKHLSITLFGIALLGIAGTTACFYGANNNGNSGSAPTKTYPNPSICESDMDWVTLSEALARIQEYNKNQWQGINDRMNSSLARATSPISQQFSDSRFITFPMDSVRKFICKVEQMIVQYGNKKEDGSPIQSSDLGVRFYYAAYTGLTPADIPNTTPKGKHTLLLVPTYLNTKGIYTEFFPAYVSESGVPLPMRSVASIDSISAKQGSQVRPKNIMFLNERVIAKNQGTLCPPPDPCNAELLSMATGY